MNREQQIETTDWLTRDITKEQLEREKLEAIMAYDLEECLIEFESGGDIYTDYDLTAQKMIAKGYRKQSGWISVDERLPDKDAMYIVFTKKFGVSISVCYLTQKGAFWAIGNSVTHWMPLPQPPKTESEELR